VNHKNAAATGQITSQISESRKYGLGRFIGPAIPSSGCDLMERQARFGCLI
jgi:hypothetical protein